MPKPGPRTTAKYSERFKATAVRLSELPGVEVQDVAASLYIHPFMLSRWRKEAREGLIMTKGVQVDKDVAAELKELRRMKKQYERLKLEHLFRTIEIPLIDVLAEMEWTGIRTDGPFFKALQTRLAA